MSKPTSQIEAEREMQRRDAARGCLLILVIEGTALLGAALWGMGRLFEWNALRSAGFFAFIAFTIAASVIVGVMVILGNTARQRRLRRTQNPTETD